MWPQGLADTGLCVTNYIFMYEQQIKRTKLIYRIFMVLGLLVIIDIVTKPILGFGITATLLAFVLGLILPDDAVYSIVGFNHSIWFIYFIIAIVMNRQIKNLEKARKNYSK